MGGAGRRQAPASAQRVGLRPEHLHLAPAGAGHRRPRVVLAEHLGDSSIIHLRVDGVDELLSAKVGAEHSQPSRPGRPWAWRPMPRWALAFGADGRLMP